MYLAYTPTITYGPLENTRKMHEYTSKNVCTIPAGADDASIQCLSPDGDVLHQEKLSAGRYAAKVDFYGRILLPPTMQEIRNPIQHELQRDHWESLQKEEERKRQEDDARTRSHLFKKLGDDHNLEVG